MHRCLQIPELVRIIASDLIKRDLAILACTCKAFKDPALDGLWRTQLNVTNLMKCMPAGTWQAVDVDGILTLKLSRELVASDWERVLEYGKRVRVLTCEDPPADEDGDPLGPTLVEVYAAVSRRVAAECLLPNLRHLSWQHHRIPLVPQLLLGSWITSVNLGPRPRGVRMLQHVGQLKTLEAMELVLNPDIMEAEIPDGTLFPDLRSAKVETEEVSELIAFMRTWSSRQLRFFSAEIVNNLKVAEVEGLYRVLAAYAHGQLSKVEVHFVYSYFLGFHDDWQERLTTDVHAGPFFRWLYPLTSLKELAITVPFGYNLGDDDISAMALSWPTLEKLVLSSCLNHRSGCTLLALSTLARHCHNLSAVEITLDASSVPTLPIYPQLAQEKLVVLDIGFSTICDAPAVAAFISSVFSKLRKIKSSWAQEDTATRWIQVNQILRS
ncbi:hypothetical protein B0H16DRAFT_1814765 [Mycena metata]|uniref:F-box domain-containing protein n=1 Tax=Mycena metata TaxID=1033252 RepID=A0AAD7MDH1_9AGAR|nr:hypothetical protein B0H16DRAFT_1814765 [Mycena metata]